MTRLLVLLAVLPTLLAGLLTGAVEASAREAAPATSAPTVVRATDLPTRLRPVGRWIVDPSGRVRLLHGVNMVYKRRSYSPSQVGFGRDDAAFLRRHGFDTVRLGLIWKAVEPRPGRYDDDYLAKIRRTTRILAAQGIWVLLDFHQDLWNERFQGEGAPDWAVLDDGVPAQPQLGFPYNYFGNLALNRAFDHFWADDAGPGGVGLQTRYARAWRHVASYFKGTPGVLGHDLFNEPWPGTGWQTCANTEGCPVFDATLQAFSQRSIDAIRRVDSRTPVFYEPHVLFNNGARTSVRPTGSRLAFSFHDYCLTAEADAEGAGELACHIFDDLVFDNADAHADETGDPPLLTEFGATTDQPTLRGMVQRAAAHLTGWQYWAYCGCDDPTTTGPGATQALVLDPAEAPRGKNVDWAKMRALVVPHPAVVAGTPLTDRYDRATRRLVVTWRPAKAGALKGRFRHGSRTVVSTPAYVYPKGYRVTVTGGRVVSDANAARLVVAQRAGVTRVRVVVTPR
ncbi:cellulase family glycosylhydrolase [Nocardioides marmoribigeumensis]|uniref:Endoglycosylceramidase n=1 Tax=Nocardioides marmoribigeumensis TaxID=433649 RepID=A0ABU2BYK7_9ACTN|nr:cellulase family glycosylhydrolase [Nocardioides marmoribigeumensis]MDR7363483.1 endoglycosylceramidase [Nocardioides marmoribigeumensis]